MSHIISKTGVAKQPSIKYLDVAGDTRIGGGLEVSAGIVVNKGGLNGTSNGLGLRVEEASSSLLASTAAQFISGSLNRVRYAMVSTGNISSGDSVVIAGFTNTENNGTFVVYDVQSAYIDVTSGRTNAVKDETGATATASNPSEIAYFKIANSRGSWDLKSPTSNSYIRFSPGSNPFSVTVSGSDDVILAAPNSGSIIPDSTGKGLGSSSARWAVFGTTADFSGAVSISGDQKVYATYTNNTGSTIVQGSVVILSQSVAGETLLANSTALATCEGVLGVAAENILTGTSGKVQTSGPVSSVLVSGGSLLQGKTVYVAQVAGYASKDVPVNTGTVVYELGVATGAASLNLTKRFVTINDNIYQEKLKAVTGSPSNTNQITGPLSTGSTYTLPLDSNNSSALRRYVVGSGLLEVYLNGQYLEKGFDWAEVGSTGALSNTITIAQSVAVDDDIVFRLPLQKSAFFAAGGVVSITGSSPLIVQDEGITLTSAASTLNFTGTGVTATQVSGVVTINVTSGSGSAITWKDEGSILSSSATTVNFTGAGITATHSSGTITVSVGALGEVNTASNSSSGIGVGNIFKGKSGVDFVFKKLKAGTNITLTNGTDDITIDASGSGGGSGEANTASNLTGGFGLFSAKSGVDLQFKSLVAGAGIAITSGANTLTIAATGGSAGEANTASNLGTTTNGSGVFSAKSGVDLQFKRIKAGSNVTLDTATDSNAIIINATAGGGGSTISRYTASSTTDEECVVQADGTGITYSRSGTTGTFTIPVGVKLLSFSLRIPASVGSATFLVVHNQGTDSEALAFPPSVQIWNDGAAKTLRSTANAVLNSSSSGYLNIQLTGLSTTAAHRIRGTF